MTPLTPEEASAAADCITFALRDASGASPVIVYVEEMRGADATPHVYVDHHATETRITNAEAARKKLRGKRWEWTPSLPVPEENTGLVRDDGNGQIWHLREVAEP